MQERELNLESYDIEIEIDLSHLTPEEEEKVRRMIKLVEAINQKWDEMSQIDREIDLLEEEFAEEADGLSDEALDTLDDLDIDY